MKRVGIILDDELHKKLKLHVVNHEISLTEFITGLIERELETKKEQSR